MIHYDSEVCSSDDLAECRVFCSIDGGPGNASCTCDAVTSMVNDISSVRSEAFTHATSYAELSTSVVGSLAQYASDRAACEWHSRAVDSTCTLHVLDFGVLPS